jgi:hypothetical protein
VADSCDEKAMARWFVGAYEKQCGPLPSVVGKAPKKTRFAAQLPHVTPSKGRSARMPTSAKAGTAGPLLRGHRCRPRRDPSNFSFAAIV